MKCRVFLFEQRKDSNRKRVPKNADKYPEPVNNGSRYCEWIYREGRDPGDHFAFTPCKPGFNYLGDGSLRSVLNRYLERRISCLICNKEIRMNYISDKTRLFSARDIIFRFIEIFEECFGREIGFFFPSIDRTDYLYESVLRGSEKKSPNDYLKWFVVIDVAPYRMGKDIDYPPYTFSYRVVLVRGLKGEDTQIQSCGSEKINEYKDICKMVCLIGEDMRNLLTSERLTKYSAELSNAFVDSQISPVIDKWLKAYE